MTLLSELHKQGISVKLDGEKVKLSGDTQPPVEIIERMQSQKQQLIDELKTQDLRAALTRLELGETPAIRIRVSDTEQVLILKDDTVPESIKVDCPSFTLTEIRLLIGSRPWQVARLYELKIGDPEMRIIGKTIGD